MTDRPRGAAYTAEQLVKLRNMVDLLEHTIRRPEGNNAQVVAQLIADIFQEIGEGDFSEVEKLLRGRASRVYLLALPTEIFGPEYVSRLMGIATDLPYALWICLNGETEARGLLMQHGLTTPENVINLANCGFLEPVFD